MLYVGESFTVVPQPLDNHGDTVQGASLNFKTLDTKLAIVSSWGEVSPSRPDRGRSESAPELPTQPSQWGFGQEKRQTPADRREAYLEFDASTDKLATKR